ncbi:MAG: hypothetical protein WCS37_17620 [Chloroflexota bacterium]|nr:hypothetical protein [Chloroflexota bacterium]
MVQINQQHLDQLENFLADAYTLKIALLTSIGTETRPVELARLQSELQKCKAAIVDFEAERNQIQYDQIPLISRNPKFATDKQLEWLLKIIRASNLNLKIVAETFRESLPPDLDSDLVSRAALAPIAMLNLLTGCPQRADKTLPLLEFTLRLAAKDPLNQYKLEAWVRQVTQDNGLVAQAQAVQLKLQAAQAPKPKTEMSPSLLISLEKPLPDQDLVRMRGWFFSPSVSEGECVYTDDAFIPLENVPQKLQKLISKLDWENEGLTLELFLPLDLIGQDLSQWKIEEGFGEETELEKAYPLVLRSWDRVNQIENLPKTYRSWKAKWDTINDSYNLNPHYCCQEDTRAKSFVTQIKDSADINSLVATFKLIPALFKQLLIAGLPVATWPRRVGIEDTEVRTAIEELITECNNENNPHFLPELLRQKRCQQIDCEDHLVHHLALWWDNPYLLPLEYKQKLEPKRSKAQGEDRR